jgi:hypothetical protein
MPKLNTTSRAAALRGQARQRELIRRVRRMGAAVDKAARDVLAQLASLPQEHGPGLTHFYARGILQSLPRVLCNVLSDHLHDIGEWGHRAAKQIAASGLSRAGLREDEFGMDDYQRYLNLLLPAPPAHQIRGIVFGTDWMERIESLSRLADPNTLASIVSYSLAHGKTQADIARELLPIVDNVRSSARRIARTEGVRVGHEVQMDAWDELGTMVVGYTLHHSANPAQRWWHAERDGRQYFKNPGPGQDGLEKMPRPPMEPPDPSERPPGTPQTAPNCLCWLTPVFAD